MPYVVDLIEHCEFDTIYHQHLCYFSVTALDRLFRRHGLFLNDVRRLAIHGGSLRIYQRAARQPAVEALLEAERAAASIGPSPTCASPRACRACARSCAAWCSGSRGKAGASPAMAPPPRHDAAQLLRLGTGELDYVVDRNPFKHGRYMPGSKLRIWPVEQAARGSAGRHAAADLELRRRDPGAAGRVPRPRRLFIIPIPEPRIV